MTYSYLVYGMFLHSDTPLPALKYQYSGSPDLALTLNSEPDWVRSTCGIERRACQRKPADPERHDSDFRLTSLGADEFFQLTYGDGTRFILDQKAKRLWGTCPAPLTIEDAATYLLGPVFGFILRRRGVVSLHASSFCINGQAVVLTGESQAGKSTTVAALALASYPVLAEDVSPIHPCADGFYVQPGYPRVCLWPDSVEALLGSPDALPALTPTWEKRFLPLDDRRAKFESQPQPLGAIYILAPRTDDSRAPYIEPLTQREALLDLVQNTYMNWLLDRSQRAAELDTLAQIVARIPVRRITPHADPARLRNLCDLITRDAASLLPAEHAAAQSA